MISDVGKARGFNGNKALRCNGARLVARRVHRLLGNGFDDLTRVGRLAGRERQQEEARNEGKEIFHRKSN